MHRLKIYFIIVATLFLGVACSKSDVEMPESQNYVLQVPANFPLPPVMPNNPFTKSGVELGKKLFFDPLLSSNNKISCASCHLPALAFSDGIALSNIGVSGTTLNRHAPALINLAWANNGLFWDGGSTNLESQAFGPISAHDEMNQNLFELENELKADKQYVDLFRKAFDSEVRSANVVKALAQFQRTLISGNSKYDQYIRAENNVQLTTQELNGLAIVRNKCASCHQEPLFTDNLYHNNGLDNDFTNTSFDQVFLGRYRVSYNPFDLGAFRTPTLRNIMLTAPYMHDGRFSNISAVLDHYHSGVKISPSLASQLVNAEGQAGIPLTISEKEDIIAFLNALTDYSFITAF